jgi:hypothetical protein
MLGPLKFKRSRPSIPKAELLDEAHQRAVARIEFSH